MSFTGLGCPLPDDETLAKLDIDPAEKTDIEKRVAALDALLAANHVGTNDPARAAMQAVARKQALDNLRQAGEIVRAQALRPKDARGYQAFMARNMASTNAMLGMSDEYTQAGWVRESFNKAKRYWRGGMYKAFRELNLRDNVAQAMKGLKPALKRAGLKDFEVDEILTDALFSGYVPHILNSTEIGTVGRKALTDMRDQFIYRLRHDYNLTEKVVSQVVGSGDNAARVFQETAAVAERAGIELPANMQRIPAILSQDVQEIWNWKWADETAGTVEWNTGQAGDVANMLIKSRATDQFIIEDEVLLDFVLRNYSLDAYGNPTELYRLATNLPDAGIRNVIEEHQALNRVVVDILNTRPQIIENLIDNGLLSKIPLSNRQTFDILTKSLDMPFRNLRDVFELDWDTGWSMYTQQLEHLAERSGYLNLLVNNAVEGKWGVTRATMANSPQAYRDFRPLVSAAGGDGVLPKSLVPAGLRDNPMLEQVYVHPTVAKLVRATFDLQRNPNAVGIFARFVHTTSTVFKRLALATVEYLPRQFWNGMINTFAGGGSLAHYGSYASKFVFMSILGKDMANVLDDVRPIFKTVNGDMLTERGLWNHLVDIGYVAKWEPLTGTEKLQQGHFNKMYHFWNPITVAHSLADRGVLHTLGKVGKGALDAVSYPTRLFNMVLDTAGRFSAIASSLGTNPLLRLSANTFDNVEEAVEHWRHYFYYYDDMTQADKVISDYVIPFWGFHSKNLPAAVRHAVRHPSRYVAYQRMFALANSPMYGDDRLNEGTTPPWMLFSSPIFFKLPNGEMFAIPTTSLDPYSGAYNFIRQPAEAAASYLGIWRGHRNMNTRQRLDRMPWSETRTNELVDQFMEQTFPLWKAIASTISNEDDIGRSQDEGATIDSFLGVRIPPLTKTWLETMLPILGTINRSNPGGIFGQAPVRDPNTGITTLGRPSVFGVPRTEPDNFRTNNPFTTLSYAGIKIYPVNWALNAGYTYDSLRYNVNAGLKFVQKARANLVTITDPQMRAQREREIEEILGLVEATRQDLIRFEDWAETKGLNVRDAAGQIQQGRITYTPEAIEDGVINDSQ